MICYHIFILDPFSAVDMTVGKHMFENGVLKMLHYKTRIVVLNSHLHFLKQFDKVTEGDSLLCYVELKGSWFCIVKTCVCHHVHLLGLSYYWNITIMSCDVMSCHVMS